jgi:hypothetical protein
MFQYSSGDAANSGSWPWQLIQLHSARLARQSGNFNGRANALRTDHHQKTAAALGVKCSSAMLARADDLVK